MEASCRSNRAALPDDSNPGAPSFPPGAPVCWPYLSHDERTSAARASLSPLTCSRLLPRLNSRGFCATEPFFRSHCKEERLVLAFAERDRAKALTDETQRVAGSQALHGLTAQGAIPVRGGLGGNAVGGGALQGVSPQVQGRLLG